MFAQNDRVSRTESPSPLAGVAGWGVAPSLDALGQKKLKQPPTLTLPREGGGNICLISETGLEI
jgi:hypothetical protein